MTLLVGKTFRSLVVLAALALCTALWAPGAEASMFCYWVSVRDGTHCWDSGPGELTCVPTYRTIVHCISDDDGGGSGGGDGDDGGGPAGGGDGDHETPCPESCPKTRPTWMPYSQSESCQTCHPEEDTHNPVCWDTGAYLSPCPEDDTTRDCCFVIYCNDPSATQHDMCNDGQDEDPFHLIWGEIWEFFQLNTSVWR